MKFAVVVFPGSNCDRDCYHVLKHVVEQPVDLVWHHDTQLSGYDCVVLPGGFSYGDYLRAGAIARFSPIMEAVADHADRGGLVLGICNGFQILTEAGILPGALLPNQSLQFRCQWVHLRVEHGHTPFTHAYQRGQVLRMPIAHGDGCYFADPATLAELERNEQIVLRYCAPDGALTDEANPNGSLANVAGVCNPARNVFGLMPHPERCSESILGGTDGLLLFQSVISATVAA